MAKKVENRRREFAEQDAKGNYDIDGVSYDGEEVIVGSEQSDNARPDPHNNTASEKLDRKKNLDSEEGTVNKGSPI